ncbi:HlyD family efflux transporter periplasmic adaptor subunit [Cellulomonas sp. McL0617]|uniref:HlyD family efflux transporter periplasmic adaptor subunit n=1 Tax=Cellulomonas sp. McL0617 TaxID=3415675 RepID=UPI003CF7F51C
MLGTAGAVVLVAAGGGVALAVTGDSGSRYRTVAAENASVEQIVDSVGTISSATRRDASFSVAGTVATVNASVGQVVTAGATLATLDTVALQDAVDKAQADLATAQQQLSDDLASQTASSSSSSASSSSSSSSSNATPASASPTQTPTPTASTPAGGGTDHSGTAGTDPAVTKAVADVQHAQQALLDQHKVVADALAASGASVTASQASCAAFLAVVPTDVTGTDAGSTDPATPTPTPTDPATDPAAPADPATPTTPDTSAVTKALADCQAALSGAMDAQTATDTQQQTLMTLATALDDSVTALQKAITQAAASTSNGSSNGSSSGAATGGSTGSQPSSGSSNATPTQSTQTQSTQTPSTKSSSTPTSGGGGSTTQAASAATILADQAAIDLAEADVALAQSKLPFATLTSPIAGTVAAVSLTAGQSVTASSSTAVITIIGTNGYVVTTTVPLNKIDIVKLGQSASLTTPSTDTKLTGKVSSIGVLDESSTSEPSYTVVLALDPTTVQLYDGASATVRLSVAGADQVLTVPTSAVHVNGTTTTVQVLKNGTPTDVTVTVGAVGAERTEITKGISLGQQVVLANLDQAISTGTSSTNSGLSGLGGNSTQGGPGSFQGGFQGGPPAGFAPGGGNG